MFDEVHIVYPAFKERPRFEAMLAVPFGDTLFLDCDSLAIAPLKSLFEVLHGWQIALSSAIKHGHPDSWEINTLRWVPCVPECVGEWNAGVITARIDANFRAFVLYWTAYYGDCRSLITAWTRQHFAALSGIMAGELPRCGIIITFAQWLNRR
jgi:hypothetical protein